MIFTNGNTMHIQGKSFSYVMYIDNGDLLNFHFGKKLANRDYSKLRGMWEEKLGYTSDVRSLDVYPQEYPAYGRSDLRDGAFSVLNKYGNTVAELKVVSYEIKDGCIETVGMPSLFGDGQTLEVLLRDEAIGLEAKLYYTVFDEHDIVARHAVITNAADVPIKLLNAASANIDLPKDDYEVISFTGAWGREREMQRTAISQGVKVSIENARGGSGHQINPFVMIAQNGADETTGEVYGLSLIYSGNHATTAKVDQFGSLRVQQGINPYGFSWELKPGESFCTPQSVICYSTEGFGKLSNEYHDVYRKHLMRSRWTAKKRPLLLNNWEGTYFGFTEEKLLSMARAAKEIGLDLFVLDDGWFGKRDDDTSGLGDWFVNYDKLPSGIDGLAEKINNIGLMFGLWFEPEMVNRDSKLYSEHPDWVIRTAEREPVEARNQLILDLSKPEVCDYIIKSVSAILGSANIGYVKWDMNRQMADMPYMGYNHRYTLGFYKIMSAITEAFPNVLFEGCSAGGGRFDAGVLAYMPQIWTSDNSDAAARLKIQYSTSMCYPVYSISTHVTASPNHQNGRITTLKTRGDTAYAGTFGYELDITQLSDEEIAEIKSQIAFDKTIQELVRDGDFYRLQNPYEGNYCSWEIVSKDKSRALLYACKVLSVAQSKDKRIKLRGLDADAVYVSSLTGEAVGGDLLMNRGIRIDYARQDFATEVIEFTKI